MHFNRVGKPTKIKKIVYLFASTVLGLLLSINIHAIIEINYLNKFLQKSLPVTFYGGCALPPYAQILIYLGGLIGGFFLGLYWWRLIYIERYLDKKSAKL